MARLLLPLKDAALRASERMARTLRADLSKRSTPRRAMIVVPFARGSLGDEAMVASLSSALASRGCNHVTLVTYRPDERWPDVPVPCDQVSLQDYFAYGSRWDHLRLLLHARKAERFFLLGADVLDGFYNQDVALRMIGLARIADAAGIPATIVGFSLNRSPAPACLQGLQALPPRVRVCCRDPISAERLRTLAGRGCTPSADIAFLLSPGHPTPRVCETQEWIRSEKANGRIVLGVNVNPQVLAGPEEAARTRLGTTFRSILETLQGSGSRISLVFLPHDVRDVPWCEGLFRAVDSSGTRCRLFPLASAAEVKRVCAGLDFAISCRMHLAIACLGQGVPVLGIEYQGKFEGLFGRFAVEHLLQGPDILFNPPRLAAVLAAGLAAREALSAGIRERYPEINQLALRNLEHPWTLTSPRE